MPDMIDISAEDIASPVMVVSQHARPQMMEALQFRPSETQVGGWDGNYTRGRNVKSFVRDNIGIIEVNGLLMTHDDFRAYMFGMTTYESIALEIGRMSDDEAIDGLVLSINSPGGLVAAVDELANNIYEARGRFSLGVHAHVMGLAESGGYWLASAAQTITVNPTALLGSIGAVLGVYKKTEGKNSNTVQFFSSVSPLKQADPESTEGKSEYQQSVDAVGDVFVEAVAKHRGVSVEVVKRDFAQGGSLVGKHAVSAGMADGVGSLEDVISRLSADSSDAQQTGGFQMAVQNGTKTNATVTPQGTPAPATVAASAPPVAPVVETLAPAVSADNSQQAVQAERTRVSGIISALHGTGMEAKAGEYIASGVDVAQVNSEIVDFMKANSAKPSAAPAQAGSIHSGTLQAMKNESAPAQLVDSGASGGGETDEKKKENELAAFNSAWAKSAQSVIARGATRKVSA